MHSRHMEEGGGFITLPKNHNLMSSETSLSLSNTLRQNFNCFMAFELNFQKYAQKFSACTAKVLTAAQIFSHMYIF